MTEIASFEAFHPRAVKLLRKQKNFIVIAEDEPYFAEAYSLIRKNEMSKPGQKKMSVSINLPNTA